jgi:hypothetical protein
LCAGFPRVVLFCFDAFSSREPVPIPHQVQDRAPLEKRSFCF